MRINEDYMDVIDREDTYDNVDGTLDKDLRDEYFCHQIDLILSGEKLESRPDFSHASDSIYPVDDDSITDVINKLDEQYGLIENLNLNWMDVSSVTKMRSLFADSNFNGDISQWNVSSVTNMSFMFYGSKFNGDISQWNVSSVTNMENMFYKSEFNGDISRWDIRSLKFCQSMFGHSSFNGDISGWDVSHIYMMNKMFYASEMNQNLSNWNVRNVKYKSEMFVGTPMQNKREWQPTGYQAFRRKDRD